MKYREETSGFFDKLKRNKIMIAFIIILIILFAASLLIGNEDVNTIYQESQWTAVSSNNNLYVGHDSLEITLYNKGSLRDEAMLFGNESTTLYISFYKVELDGQIIAYKPLSTSEYIAPYEAFTIEFDSIDLEKVNITVGMFRVTVEIMPHDYLYPSDFYDFDVVFRDVVNIYEALIWILVIIGPFLLVFVIILFKRRIDRNIFFNTTLRNMLEIRRIKTKLRRGKSFLDYVDEQDCRVQEFTKDDKSVREEFFSKSESEEETSI